MTTIGGYLGFSAKLADKIYRKYLDVLINTSQSEIP